MKEPHTALFIAPTGVAETHLALNLLESEYKNHFDFIIIICYHSLWLLTQSYTAVPSNIRDKQRCFTFGTQKIEQI